MHAIFFRQRSLASLGLWGWEVCRGGEGEVVPVLFLELVLQSLHIAIPLATFFFCDLPYAYVFLSFDLFI